MDDSPVVLFDAECFFCRNLAAWLQQRSRHRWRLESWQTHAQQYQHADTTEQLHVWFGQDQYLRGVDAWHYLLNEEPGLVSLQWLSQKLGWEKAPAKFIHRTSSFMRRLCRTCP
ncbi:MAG: DCC1-like thiol-disulfide oxidoreductase family protein [Oligoflexus sp.]